MRDVVLENLEQLKSLLSKIKIEDYTAKPDVLCGASIGQHMRHILEFYIVLNDGAPNGRISYDKRKRDTAIEESTEAAIQAIDNIIKGLEPIDINQEVEVDADFTKDWSDIQEIKSNMLRELAYCVEHSIHHQALIKAGLVALNIQSLADEHFGVAYSTIRFRENIQAR